MKKMIRNLQEKSKWPKTGKSMSKIGMGLNVSKSTIYRLF